MDVKAIYGYADRPGWGREIVAAARQHGLKAHLFHYAWQVPNREGAVSFLRMRNSRTQRGRNKRLAIKLARKSHLRMLPFAHECDLYDNKLLQAQTFQGWLPATHVLTDREHALAKLTDMEFPFVSKASEGAAAVNVRLIRNPVEARAELDAVFSSNGLPTDKGMTQKDYVIWQEFLGGNPNDWRVDIIAGRYAYIVKRHNRHDLPFASGSGQVDTIHELDDELVSLLEYARSFAVTQRLSVAALDIVRDPRDGCWRLLESSCAWGRSCLECRFFSWTPEAGWGPMDHVATDLAEVIVNAIEKGEFW